MTAIEHQKITEACDILFGENFRADMRTFNYLQVSGIKTAYRQRVKSCHPDLISGNENQADHGKKFCEVKAAYDYLLNMKTPEIKTQKYKTKDKFYDSFIPLRKLKLGEYLYYSGTISWSSLINAIVWQKKNSLRIGNYFLRNGILKTDELTTNIIKMNMHNRKY